MRKISTRDLIILSLREMMNKRPYDEITVSDILKDTGIARSTFYRHFQDKQGVLEFIFNDVVVAGNIFDYSRDIKTREADLLRTMLKNPRFWSYIHENPAFNHIWRAKASESTQRYLEEQNQKQDTGTQDLLSFFCLVLGSAFVMLNHDVLNGTLRMSPDEMGASFQAIIDIFLKNSNTADGEERKSEN